jgi:hypothetical protein
MKKGRPQAGLFFVHVEFVPKKGGMNYDRSKTRHELLCLRRARTATVPAANWLLGVCDQGGNAAGIAGDR